MARKHLLPILSFRLFSCTLLLLVCLPLLSFYHPTHTSGLGDLTGPLTAEQHAWLEENPSAGKALSDKAGIANWSDRQMADAIFDYFTEEANPLLITAAC